MRVAYIAECIPYPPRIAAQQRRFNLLRAYASQDWRVTVFALSRGREEDEAAEQLRQYCEEIIAVPFASTRAARLARQPRWVQSLVAGSSLTPWTAARYSSPLMQRALRGWQTTYDVVHVSRVTSVSHLGPVCRWGEAGRRVVLDLDDVESLVRRRALQAGVIVGWRARASMRREQLRLKYFEKRMLRACGSVLVCSNDDRLRMGGPNTVVIPNGIEIPEVVLDSGGGDGRTLLFVGFMEYAPNADGVRWFVREVLPLIRRSVGRVRMVIVGRATAPEVLTLHDGESVEVVGEVTDLEPYYRAATVVVVPIRMGGGTRIKILEAFAWKRPVVSTALGAEGIPAERGREIFVEDEPVQFAARCVELLREPRLRAAVAERARGFVQQYEWAGIRARLVGAVLDQRRGHEGRRGRQEKPKEPRGQC